MNTLLRTVLRGAVYSTLRALPLRLVLVLGAIALVAFVLVNGASAATYETACPVDTSTPPVQTDPVCERLTALVAAVEALPQDHPASIEVSNFPEAGTTEVAGTVALGADDADRLDLIWIGIWLLAGLSIGMWFAGKVWAEFRQWFHT